MRQLQQEIKGPSAELQPQRSGRVGPFKVALAIILHLFLCCTFPLISTLPRVKLIVLRQVYAHLSPLQGGSSLVQEDASYRRPRPSRTMEQAPDGSYKVPKTFDAGSFVFGCLFVALRKLSSKCSSLGGILPRGHECKHLQPHARLTWLPVILQGHPADALLSSEEVGSRRDGLSLEAGAGRGDGRRRGQSGPG